MLVKMKDSYSETDNSDSHDESQYSFRLFHFKEIKCWTGEGGPKPRSGHRIVHHKGRIYSFGGFNPAIELNDPDLLDDEHWVESMPLFKELWELNLTTGRWSKCEMKGDIPDQLASHAAVCHPLDPSVMLIYGGTGTPFGWNNSNTVVSCHLETKQFKKLLTKEGEGLPMALYGQAVVTDNEGLFYTVGGTSGKQLFMDVNMLDLRSSPPVWTSLYRLSGVMDEPGPRYSYSEITNFRHISLPISTALNLGHKIWNV